MHEYTGGKRSNPVSLATEQEAARELIKEYQQLMSGYGKRRYGANRIVADMYSGAEDSSTWTLNGDDLKHWLAGRTRNLGDSKFQPIKEFIAKPEFIKAVERAKQNFDPLSNTIRLGYAHAQTQGYDLSSRNYETRLGLNGIWMLSPEFTEELRTETEPIDDLGRMSRMKALLNYAQTVGWFAEVRSITSHGFSIAHFLEVDEQPDDFRQGLRVPTDGCVRSSGFLFQDSGGCIDGLIWNRDGRDEYRCNFIVTPKAHSTFILKPMDGFRGFINPANKPLLAFKLSRFFEILNMYQPTDTASDDAEHIKTVATHILTDRTGTEQALGEMFDTLGFDMISTG